MTSAALRPPEPRESCDDGLPIADVAERTGLSKDTLRYYEKAHLIEAVGRSSGGQRRYAVADLAGLAAPQRQLVTLGILTALGGCEPQLDVHINASLNVGLSPVEIVETLTHAAVYCGFPKALNAIFVAKRVFGERGLLPVNTPAA